MIDLHTHSIFSDGALVPSELVRRAEYLGLEGLGITDHGDMSNIDFVVPRIVEAAKRLNGVLDIKIVPGIEITHVPPELIPEMAEKARLLGAKIVIVHGETLVEPVAPGTNHAALNSDIDILAHPGLISMQDVLLAKKKKIFLEISSRKGHSLSNGHLARLAVETGAPLVLNTDAHGPGDFINKDFALKVALAAGLSKNDFAVMLKNSSTFL